MQRLYDKLQTFSDHFFCQTNFVRWVFATRSEYIANNYCKHCSSQNICSIFVRYSHKDSFSVRENPYFGILISEDLKWEPHLTKITQKANSILAFLKRNLRHCPEPCRRTAYISLVRSRSFWVNNLLRVLKSVTWLDALAKRMSWEIYTP